MDSPRQILPRFPLAQHRSPLHFPSSRHPGRPQPTLLAQLCPFLISLLPRPQTGSFRSTLLLSARRLFDLCQSSRANGRCEERHERVMLAK